MYHNKDAFHTSEHKQTHVIQTSLVVLAALFLPRGKKILNFSCLILRMSGLLIGSLNRLRPVSNYAM